MEVIIFFLSFYPKGFFFLRPKSDPHAFLPDIPLELKPWIWVILGPPCPACSWAPETAGDAVEGVAEPGAQLLCYMLLRGGCGGERGGQVGAWSHTVDPDGQLRSVARPMSLTHWLASPQLSSSKSGFLEPVGLRHHPFCHTGWAARAGVPCSQHQCLTPG